MQAAERHGGFFALRRFGEGGMRADRARTLCARACRAPAPTARPCASAAHQPRNRARTPRGRAHPPARRPRPRPYRRACCPGRRMPAEGWGAGASSCSVSRYSGVVSSASAILVMTESRGSARPFSNLVEEGPAHAYHEGEPLFVDLGAQAQRLHVPGQNRGEPLLVEDRVCQAAMSRGRLHATQATARPAQPCNRRDTFRWSFRKM